METTKRNAKVGLFMLIGLIIFAGVVMLISNMRKVFVQKIDAVAVFEDVAGLNKGNNVMFSGVKVGTVAGLEFIPGKGVEVDFEIEEKSRKFIFKDADVKISTDGLIGNPILVIAGGDVKSGAIESGHRFKVSKEDSQQDMIKTLQENNKNILAITEDLKGIMGSISRGEGSIGKLLKDDELYDNVNQTVAKLEAMATSAQGVATNLNKFSADLSNPKALPYQLTHNTTIMPALETTTGNLMEGTKALKSTMTEANLMMTDVRKDVGQITDNITNNKTSTLGVLLNDKATGDNVKETLDNLSSGTEKLDENLEALKSNIFFRRYYKKKAKAEAKAKEALLEEGK
ncbi:MlaD family protein [Arcticibacterium luteifluviistationis]|uniref:MCE family protein n=1 Tax=Arcticibacterium luteifluviistationis TaxID=1784714 RepID=A0A2Z4GG85_9BACT|nr:MlaD family protein [Arcticibacterium luteifluviistationis]AWW00413.1 MCE family protein [Arcticibacterium luteifluviistationis]